MCTFAYLCTIYAQKGISSTGVWKTPQDIVAFKDFMFIKNFVDSYYIYGHVNPIALFGLKYTKHLKIYAVDQKYEVGLHKGLNQKCF